MTPSERRAEQRADIDGQGNVIVQILGNDNRVDLARPYLKLTRYLTRRRIDSDADLLSPYARSIPLVGRGQELADLRAWLGSSRPVAVRVLTGRAGAGKTRLALELCEQVLVEGWAVGFLESEELHRFQDRQNFADWGWGRPTLIVIDYAAVHAERLGRWFGELADNPGEPERPLRLLLLERHAEPGAGWWQTAFGRGGFGARAVQKLLDPAGPVALPPLATTDERRAVLGETLEQATRDQRPPAVGSDPAFDRQLAELTWGGEPLFLMMAGLMARDAGMGSVLALGRTDLAFQLADRELARIARIGETNGVDPNFLAVMAGYATLCRGLGTTAIRAAVPSEQAALGLPAAGDPGKIARVLCEALPAADGGADPILPEMIGEAAVLRAFGTYDDRGNTAVYRAFDRAGQQVAATVIRIAQDFVGAGYAQPLAWLDTLASSVDLDQMMTIADQLPPTSLALLPYSAQITGQIVKALREKVKVGESRRLPQLASALNNFAIRQSAVGQSEAAFGLAKEAVELYRGLAAKAPDAYRPDLAMALDNFAVSLSEVGQREAALRAAREAVELYRALAAEAPDVYWADLAMALDNLATLLSAVGQREAALALAKEAAEIFHELAAVAPDAWRSDRATALNNLANRLSEVGQREGALESAKEAADLYRKLAAQAPDAYLPLLAMALNNLAAHLSAVGQHEAALEAVWEAVALRRELAASAPDTHKPDLAVALNNLATHLSSMAQGEGALAAATEAVSLYRELAAKAPDAYRPALGMALNNLATRLSEVGRREAALELAQEAFAIRRELAAQAPDAYRPDLASALNNLSNHLSETGQRELALATAREAVELYRELATKAPDAYRPDLASALNNLANRMSASGQREAALRASEEAIHTLSPYFLALPHAYASPLIAVVQNYLLLCQETGAEPDLQSLGPIAESLHWLHEYRQSAEARAGTV